MKSVVAIALSGGIDSLVAAYLLKEQGWDPFGLHFITGFESCFSTAPLSPDPFAPSEPVAAADHPIRRIGDQLGIPVYIVDCRRPFLSEVVSYFCRTYGEGQTPNPCLVCNPKIKFGFLLEMAIEMGAVTLATGHYARVVGGDGGRFRLLQGADGTKDQSYFLSFLNQAQLSRAVFPLGDITKETVRGIAAQQNLIPIDLGESQDVCFIKGRSYGEFLTRWGQFESTPGPITTIDGRIIGTHNGLHLFTIGQRKGINCPAAAPYYVVQLSPTQNRLIVGTKADLIREECRVRDINWIREPIGAVFDAHVRLRYRHRAVGASIRMVSPDRVTVRFHSPQSAVTPGQGAVFYKGEEVLGGGWIES